MIAVTSKAAKRFKLTYRKLPPVDTGAWVVDLIKIARGPLLVLIVHQDSLFTLIRQSRDVKTIDDVAREIARVWPMPDPVESTIVSRNTNRHVTGSITDMKHLIRVWAKFEALPKVEAMINDTPFSAIGMEHPLKRFSEICMRTPLIMRSVDMTNSTSNAIGQVLRLRISLVDSAPEIWRELEVPASFALGELHEVIQVSMGWENYHLHEFSKGDRTFGTADDEAPDHEEDEEEVGLLEVLSRKGSSLTYLYDFGDNWKHEIKRVGAGRMEPDVEHPRCTDGACAGPPEDVGGTWKYNTIVHDFTRGGPDALDRDRREWLGPDFDPARFEIEEVNTALLLWTRGLSPIANDLDDDFDEVDDEYECLFNYDAAHTPDPEEWLEFDETEQLIAVEKFHEIDNPHPPPDRPYLHYIAHSVIETQIATGDPKAVSSTFDRLMSEGLDRHEAIHALGHVLTYHIAETLSGGKAGYYPADVERLTVEAWRAGTFVPTCAPRVKKRSAKRKKAKTAGKTRKKNRK